MGHEDDDRHAQNSYTQHRIFQDVVFIQEDAIDGDQWNVSVIRSEEPQSDEPTWVLIVEGWRRAQKYCSVTGTGTERGSNIQTSWPKPLHTPEDNLELRS